MKRWPERKRCYEGAVKSADLIYAVSKLIRTDKESTSALAEVASHSGTEE